MELNNIFTGLMDVHNFLFIGKFDKHNYYKDIDLFKDLNINNIKSNTEWECKLQTNFPGDDNTLLNTDITDKMYEDILSYLKRELKKYKITGLSYQTGPWYNIYKKGFNQEKHNHLSDKSLLSGCYYYSYPSTIEFSVLDKKSKFEPDEGNIFLFSCEMNHAVPIYNGDDIRISFAFNLNVKEVLR